MTTKTDQELIKLLTDTREAIRTERFASAGARAKDSTMHSKLRREVARVLTEQSRRLLESASRAEAVGHATA